MNNPKISIIIPCYGVEKYLDRCMETIINQTLCDIEIILVDDGSPDNVPAMCDEWAKKDARVKVFHKENAGLGYARNTGLDVAIGEYVAFIDSDDYIDTGMYDKLYTIATCENADAIFCGTRREVSSGYFVNQQECSEPEIFESEKIVYFYLNMVASAPYTRKERLYGMSVWRAIYKREYIKKYGIRFLSEREYVSEDLPFQIDFLQQCKKVVLLPDILHTYCLNQTSLTHTFHKEKFDRFVKLYFYLKKQTKEVDPKFYHANRFVIGYTRSYLYGLIKSSLHRKEKMTILNRLCNSKVWKEVTYCYKFLPIHSAICHYLVINKYQNCLYLYMCLYIAIKQRLKWSRILKKTCK